MIKSGQNGDIENERGRSKEKRQARGIVLVTHIIAAVVKIIGFLFSGSAVLMNESIHSVIDCLNQGLLAIGEKRARRGRSELYQFGEGRATYFLVRLWQ